MARQHTDMDRVNTVDKALAAFGEKVGFCDSLPLHGIQELLKAMKFRSGQKSLNYAIAPTCIDLLPYFETAHSRRGPRHVCRHQRM